MALRILLTGGAGFSGSHLADAIIDQTDWDLIVLDCLTYAGKMENLAHMPADRFEFIDKNIVHCRTYDFEKIGQIDYIIHLAAETHVQNSLVSPTIFMYSNVLGTHYMLEVARELRPKKFLYVSTDEVFGASLIPHKEYDALNPSNPYSASKAAGEMLIRAYGASFQVPWLITRTTNIFGTRQHEEKMVPMTIKKIRDAEKITIHTDREGYSGSRQWIHASDQASAIIFLLQNALIGDTYHIAGQRVSNSGIVDAIAAQMQKTADVEFRCAYDEFPGHDIHYALDDSKIRAMGWKPKLTFEQGLALTVNTNTFRCPTCNQEGPINPKIWAKLCADDWHYPK